jgi:hypothetical protein
MKMFFVSGGPITGYWVEKREENTDKWIPVNISPIQSTHYTVPSLLEDHVYEFRVIAENEAGKGSPSEASKLTRVKKSFSFFDISKLKSNFDRLKMQMHQRHRNFLKNYEMLKVMKVKQFV